MKDNKGDRKVAKGLSQVAYGKKMRKSCRESAIILSSRSSRSRRRKAAEFLRSRSRRRKAAEFL